MVYDAIFESSDLTNIEFETGITFLGAFVQEIQTHLYMDSFHFGKWLLYEKRPISQMRT